MPSLVKCRREKERTPEVAGERIQELEGPEQTRRAQPRGRLRLRIVKMRRGTCRALDF